MPYTSKDLLGSSAGDVAISPFTLVFKRVGLAGAASIVNAVILTSVISAANSGMYASTRMLWAMSKQKIAPKVFSHVNRHGVPVAALLMTTVVGLFTFLTSIWGPQIYLFLVSASGLTGFIAWLGIAISHYRFRKAFIRQGHHLSELHYHAKLFPVEPILAMVLGILVIIGQDLHAVQNFDWQALGISYMSVPLFIILFVYYKLRHKTHLIPLDQVDLSKADQD